MTALHLPSLLAQDADQLAGAIIAKHGGRAAMSVVDLEVVASMVKVFSAMRAASPDSLPKLVDSLSKLEQMLPSVAGSARTPLERLHEHCAGVGRR